MHLAILEKQEKYSYAFTLLDGPLGLFCKVEAERERMCIDLLMKSCQWELAEQRSRKLLLLTPDDWLTHVRLVDSLSKIAPLMKGKVKEMDAFYKALQSTVKNEKHGTRGPYMGELLFFSKFKNDGKSILTIRVNFVETNCFVCSNVRKCALLL